MAKILIADDHPLFRDAMMGALTAHFDGIEIIQADNLESILAAIDLHPDLDLVLLDLHMPGCENFYGVIKVSQDFPNLPLAVVSASESVEIVSHVMSFGAKGFIPKSTPTEAIAGAITEIMNGGSWLPEGMRKKILAVGEESLDIAQKVSELTPKQFEVLKYIQDGLLNKQIAYELSITEATVKAHISAIFRKFNVNTRTQAVLILKQLSLEP